MTLGPELIHVSYAGTDEVTRQSADERARHIYRQYGCLLAKSLFSPQELAPIQDYLQRLVHLRLAHAGMRPEPESDGLRRFDDGFVQMTQRDRRHGSAIFDACRRLLPLHQLSVNEKLIRIARNLMETDLLIASDIKAIRIDIPEEDKYLFDWHQDYPYVMDSEDALVFWMPMHDVDESNGCLKVALGSHQLGLLKLRVHDLRNSQNNKQRFMEIADKTVVERFPQVRVPVQAGDVLVFSTLLLHASGPNQSSRARWTAQIRFGNFRNPRAIQRDWPGSLRDGHWFDQKHAEYVVNMKELQQAAAA